MSNPDPNGCSRCGLATCRLMVSIAVAAERAPFRGAAAYVAVDPAVMVARKDCESRPAVDWQAAYRAAVTPREPVARVEGVVAVIHASVPSMRIQIPRRPIGDLWMPAVWPTAKVGDRVSVEVFALPEGA